MKASIFRKFYLTFVNLYGVIFSEDAYQIMKHYFPELKKKDLNKDLKERSEKMTRRYAVLRTGDRRSPYIICEEFLFDEDIDEILKQQAGKPFFYCDELEEYFSYADHLGDNPGYKPMVNYAYQKLRKKTDKKEAKVLAELFVSMICERIHFDFSDGMKAFQEIVQKMIDTLEPEDEDEVNEMLKLYMDLQANTRMIVNRGYSPRELSSLMPTNPDELTIQIGDNMRSSMLEDDVDIDEMIEELKKDTNMPEKMRNDLIAQFEEIKLLKDNKAKA